MHAQGMSWFFAAWVGLASSAPLQQAQAGPPEKAKTVAQAEGGDWLYRIQPGDTLIALTAAYLQDRTSWRELQRVNHVANPLKLPPGSTLKMPVALLRREASVATVIFTQSEASLIRAPNAATPLLDRADLSGTELRLTLPPGRYHYRLASIARGADLGPFGDPQALTMRPIPPTPALSPPEIGDKALSFRWPAAQGAARYKAQWAADVEFKQLLAEPTVDQPALTLPRPGTGSYFLRVQSIDAEGYAGPFGTPQQIDIPRSRWLWLLPLGLLLLVM